MQDRTDYDSRAMPQAPPPPPPLARTQRGGIGFAVFLLLAGLVLLAERLGWVPNGFDWFFPVILIAWGLGELWHRLSQP